MPLLEAAGALGAGLATSAFNLFSAEQSRDYNREMASTSHQREVKDLRAAGLNPVLSAGGHGASVAPSPTPQSNDFMGTSKAIEMMQLKNQNRLVDAQVRDINSAAALKEIEGRIKLRTEPESIDRIREELYRVRQDIDMSDINRRHLDEIIETMGIERDIKRNEKSHSAYDLSKSKSESEFYSGAGGEIEHWLRMLGIQMPNVNVFKGRGKTPGRRKITNKTITNKGGGNRVEETEYWEGGDK